MRVSRRIVSRRTPSRLGAGAVALALGTAWPAPAFAHHDTDPGPTPEALDWTPLGTDAPSPFRFGLTASYTDTDERSYASLGSRLDVEPIARLRTALVVPVHEVKESGAESETGLGDIDLMVSARLWDHSSARLHAGIALRTPTGDETLALGGGVFRLSPHLMADLGLGELRVRAVAGDSFALSEPMAEHGDVEPQSPHELFYELTAGWSPGSVFLGGTIGGATVLAEAARGDTPLWTGPRLVWVVTERAALSMGALVPVTEPRRFGARVSIGSHVAF